MPQETKNSRNLCQMDCSKRLQELATQRNPLVKAMQVKCKKMTRSVGTLVILALQPCKIVN